MLDMNKESEVCCKHREAVYNYNTAPVMDDLNKVHVPPPPNLPSRQSEHGGAAMHHGK